MARKRLGLNKLDRTKRTPKPRNNRNRTGADARLKETYAIYIGDRTSASGRKVPIFGTISEGSLRKLKLSIAELQKLADSTYTTTAGLKTTYIFKDKLLWKTTTGKSGDTDYNVSAPIPVQTCPAKLKIALQGSTALAADAIEATVGIPSLTSIATVAEFIGKIKLDSNSKALRWKWGKNGATLKELGKKSSSRGSSKKSSSPEWYVPIGNDSSTKLNKNGTKSVDLGNVKKALIIASMVEETAEALGFEKSGDAANANQFKLGTDIAASIDNNAQGGKAKYYDVFSKLKAYSAIWTKSDSTEKAGMLDPGTGLSVKARFSKFKRGEALGNISRGRTERSVNKSSQTYSFRLPSGVPVGVVFEMLMNCPNRPTSFQVSSDNKTYGKSYRLPPKQGKSQLIGR